MTNISGRGGPKPPPNGGNKARDQKASKPKVRTEKTSNPNELSEPLLPRNQALKQPSISTNQASSSAGDSDGRERFKAAMSEWVKLECSTPPLQHSNLTPSPSGDFPFQGKPVNTGASSSKFKAKPEQDLKTACKELAKKLIDMNENPLADRSVLISGPFTTLPPLPHDLRSLVVTNCPNLGDFGLSKYRELENFQLANCPSVVNGPNLLHCSKLRVVVVVGQGREKSPPDPGCFPELERYEVSNVDSQKPLDFSNNPNIRIIRLHDWQRMKTPPLLRNNTELKELTLTDWLSIKEPPDVSYCSKLEVLNLYHNVSMESLPGLLKNGQLASINFSRNSSIVDPPAYLPPTLKIIDMDSCWKLKEPPDLSGQKSLLAAYFNGCDAIQSMPKVVDCESLLVIEMPGCRNLNEINPHAFKLPKLISVWLSPENMTEKLRKLLDQLIAEKSPQTQVLLGYRPRENSNPTLADMAKAWRHPQPDAVRSEASLLEQRTWTEMEMTTAHAGDFAQFLQRLWSPEDLHEFTSVRAEFRPRVSKLLRQVEADPTLRKQVFEMAVGAVDSSKKGLLLKLLLMETACIKREGEHASQRGGDAEKTRARLEENEDEIKKLTESQPSEGQSSTSLKKLQDHFKKLKLTR